MSIPSISQSAYILLRDNLQNLRNNKGDNKGFDYLLELLKSIELVFTSNNSLPIEERIKYLNACSITLSNHLLTKEIVSSKEVLAAGASEQIYQQNVPASPHHVSIIVSDEQSIEKALGLADKLLKQNQRPLLLEFRFVKSQ